MEPFFLIAILSIVIGSGVYFFMGHVPRKRRRLQHLTQQAAGHGFTVAAEEDVAPKEKFGCLRLFSLQTAGKMENVFRRDNPTMWIFDYEYTNCIARGPMKMPQALFSANFYKSVALG